MLRLPATPITIATASSRAAPDCCRPITIWRCASTICSPIARAGAKHAAVGKTVVSSSMIDRVAAKLGRQVFEVPVGFKWFVDGLLYGSLGFAGEESAGASFLARDGSAWSTDKDGIIAALLSAEITARTGRDPGEIYAALEREHGVSDYERIDAPANAEQRAALAKLSPQDITATELAGEKIQKILTTAPGDGSPIGGIKVIAENGWFAARPSGTEDVYKIYAESFRGRDHLKKIQEEAQAMVSAVLGAITSPPAASGLKAVRAVIQQIADALQADVRRRILLEHLGIVRIVPLPHEHRGHARFPKSA